MFRGPADDGVGGVQVPEPQEGLHEGGEGVAPDVLEEVVAPAPVPGEVNRTIPILLLLDEGQEQVPQLRPGPFLPEDLQNGGQDFDGRWGGAGPGGLPGAPGGSSETPDLRSAGGPCRPSRWVRGGDGAPPWTPGPAAPVGRWCASGASAPPPGGEPVAPGPGAHPPEDRAGRQVDGRRLPRCARPRFRKGASGALGFAGG